MGRGNDGGQPSHGKDVNDSNGHHFLSNFSCPMHLSAPGPVYVLCVFFFFFLSRQGVSSGSVNLRAGSSE